MQFKEYKKKFIEELTTIYDEVEVENFFYLILEHFHKLKRVDLALQPDLVLKSSEIENWELILTELKKQKPIQYILGETEFFGLPFIVNENTLIPRPETEELVDWIISDINKIQIVSQKLQILDIGTGSGCIAISLAKNIKNTQVYAIDVSSDALAVAKKNAEINNVNVQFLQKNILEVMMLEHSFDIIVSNPPYVRNLEKHEIKPNVLDYEPHLALFVEDEDALLFYRKIAQLAQNSLTKKGKLYFEINQYLGKETVELLEKLGFKEIVLKKDIYGNDRMISCGK